MQKSQHPEEPNSETACWGIILTMLWMFLLLLEKVCRS